MHRRCGLSTFWTCEHRSGPPAATRTGIDRVRFSATPIGVVPRGVGRPLDHFQTAGLCAQLKMCDALHAARAGSPGNVGIRSVRCIAYPASAPRFGKMIKGTADAAGHDTYRRGGERNSVNSCARGGGESASVFATSRRCSAPPTVDAPGVSRTYASSAPPLRARDVVRVLPRRLVLREPRENFSHSTHRAAPIRVSYRSQSFGDRRIGPFNDYPPTLWPPLLHHALELDGVRNHFSHASCRGSQASFRKTPPPHQRVDSRSSSRPEHRLRVLSFFIFAPLPYYIRRIPYVSRTQLSAA